LWTSSLTNERVARAPFPSPKAGVVFLSAHYFLRFMSREKERALPARSCLPTFLLLPLLPYCRWEIAILIFNFFFQQWSFRVYKLEGWARIRATGYWQGSLNSWWAMDFLLFLFSIGDWLMWGHLRGVDKLREGRTHPARSRTYMHVSYTERRRGSETQNSTKLCAAKIGHSD